MAASVIPRKAWMAVTNNFRVFGLIKPFSVSKICAAKKSTNPIKSESISRRKLGSKIIKGGSYNDVQALRMKEAQCSVIINGLTRKLLPQVIPLIERAGQVENIFAFQTHFHTGSTEFFALVEFTEEQSVKNLLQQVGFKTKMNKNYVPVASRLINSNIYSSTCSPASHSYKSKVQFYTQPNHLKFNKQIKQAESVSEQMRLLHQFHSMTDIDTRLRYFMCLLIKEQLKPLFPYVTVLPFGSCVNHFGRYDCDVDLQINLGNQLSVDQAQTDTPLVHLFKECKDARMTDKRNLRFISDLLRFWMPYMDNFHNILSARVPIVKCYHILLALDCDITVGNNSAIFMSELLYLYGQVDHRVQPLIFTLRHWARTNGLNSSMAGPWVTNFQLTLLTLFFLMQEPNHLLPSVQTLSDVARDDEIRVCRETKEKYAFPSDVQRMPKFNTDATLGELLQSFFLFYGNFDFKSNQVSLIEGQIRPKSVSDDFPLHLENPLDPKHNAGKSTNQKYLKNFQGKCLSAYNCLEKSHSRSKDRWGLMKLLTDIPACKDLELDAFEHINGENQFDNFLQRIKTKDH